MSSDGETRPLPQPFVVLATDNPIEYEGTYALPEAQLDRFLLRVPLGYLAHGRRAGAAARDGCGTAGRRPTLSAVVDAETVLAMRESLEQVEVEAVGAALRRRPGARHPRRTRRSPSAPARAAGWRWSRWPAARPCSSGRDYVTPEDVKAVAVPALAHRISLRPELWVRRVTSADVVDGPARLGRGARAEHGPRPDPPGLRPDPAAAAARRWWPGWPWRWPWSTSHGELLVVAVVPLVLLVGVAAVRRTGCGRGVGVHVHRPLRRGRRGRAGADRAGRRVPTGSRPSRWRRPGPS